MYRTLMTSIVLCTFQNLDPYGHEYARGLESQTRHWPEWITMLVGTHPSQTHGVPDHATTDRGKKRTSHSSQTRGLPNRATKNFTQTLRCKNFPERYTAPHSATSPSEEDIFFANDSMSQRNLALNPKQDKQVARDCQSGLFESQSHH